MIHTLIHLYASSIVLDPGRYSYKLGSGTKKTTKNLYHFLKNLMRKSKHFYFYGYFYLDLICYVDFFFKSMAKDLTGILDPNPVEK